MLHVNCQFQPHSTVSIFRGSTIVGCGTPRVSVVVTPSPHLMETTLETRRVRGDQIEVFKITHGIEGLDSGMFFKYRTDNGTRGHRWALAKERCKLDIRKYAFSQRTINEWNRLPGECVNATSVNMFKNKIDNYFKRSGYV